MDAAAADAQPCRTCGRPRGPNLAEGTRCARCGVRHALMVWLAAAFAAGEWTLYYGGRFGDALTAAVVTFACFVPAVVGAVFVHELCHALAGRLLGQTVSRVLVGEGRAIVRVGRNPEFVFGSVLVGNGLTTAMDLRLDAYRTRMSAMLLSAPILSLAVGAIAWTMSVPAPRRGAIVCVGEPRPGADHARARADIQRPYLERPGSGAVLMARH